MTTLSIDLSNHVNLSELPSVPKGLFAKKISVTYDEESQEKTNWYFVQYIKHTLCYDTYKTHGLFRSVLTDGKTIQVFFITHHLYFVNSNLINLICKYPV